MSSIISAVLRFRVLVLAIAVLAAYFGTERLQRMPMDVLPEFNPPVVEIQTEAPGLSANEVELMVSFGVEELVSGLPWVKTLKSYSVTGLSTVRLEFEPGTDLMRARQLVQERLTTSFLLPNVAKPPVMQQPISSANRILMVALSSKELDAIKLSTITTWTVKPRLLGIPGVANVAVWGERRRQIQVQMDMDKMRAANVRQQQVIASTGDALWMSPLSFLKSSVPGTGGWIDTPNQRLEIRHVLPMSSAADIARIGVDGTSLRLGDIADVVEGHPPLIGDAVIADGEGLLLVVEKFPGADTVAVTRAVEDAMNGLRPGLQGISIDVRGFRPASFVEWSFTNVKQAAILGIATTLFGLGLLLFQVRAPLIGLVSIGLTIVTSVLVLSFFGVGLNLLVIAGLGAALVLLIDDVVVASDGLFRRLMDERRKIGRKLPLATVIESARAEAAKPLAFATLIILFVVTPILFLEGFGGAITRPVVLAYGLAILTSIIVTFTVVPALLSLLYRSKLPVPTGEPPIAKLASHMLQGLVGACVRNGGAAIAIVAGLAIAALALAPRLQSALSSVQATLPHFNERDLVIQFDGPGGASHPEMMRQTSSLVADLKGIAGVSSAYAHIGRAIGGDQIVNVNSSRVWVSINSNADYAKVLAAVQKSVERYTDVDRRVRTYLGDRLGLDLDGNRRVVARIYGHRLDELRRLAKQAKEMITRIDGLGGVRIEDQIEEDQLHVTVDLEAAAKHGLKPGDVRRLAATLFSGLEVGRIFEAQKVFEVVVWSKPEIRKSTESVAAVLIELPRGGHVRLGDVAKIELKPMPSLIKREGVSLYLDIVVDAGLRPQAAATADVEARMKEIKYPLGYYPAMISDQREGTSNRVVTAALVAAVGVFLLLQAFLGSWRLAIAIFVTLPVCLAGGLALCAILALPVSLGALFGLLAIYALSARMTLAYLAHLQLRDVHNGPSARSDAIVVAAGERLAPIATTLISVALAMAPTVYLSGKPGLELLYPMAAAILGGLMSLGLYMMFVVPWLYLRFGEQLVADLVLEPAE